MHVCRADKVQNKGSQWKHTGKKKKKKANWQQRICVHYGTHSCSLTHWARNTHLRAPANSSKDAEQYPHILCILHYTANHLLCTGIKCVDTNDYTMVHSM